MRPIYGLFLLLAACKVDPVVDTDTDTDPIPDTDPGDTDTDTPVDTDTDVPDVDADGDGSPEGIDCDDGNDAVFPGAAEVCNGVDDDCDGHVDIEATDASSWYHDGDSDGDGDPTDSLTACTQPEGYVAVGEDCDDDDPDVLSGVGACGHVVDAASCKDALDAGEDRGDGTYFLEHPSLPDGGITVWCDMTTDGGGWIAVARALDEAYETLPPAIGPGTDGTWAEWTAHDWRSGESYYLPLDTFATLTDGTSEVMQMSRDVDGTVLAKLVYGDFDYDAITNTSTIGSCTDLVGIPCSAGYSWKNYPPGFNGWGRNDYCNQAYPSMIWNYHPETGCASASGLFAYTATSTPHPQLLGAYTSVAPENLILVR